ncbi:helix-turn-helix domain-containing protein [Ignavigranum ruoffiae]|uniref:Helix-turn-helix domain-containing protein n=1 Tax=Ignavigranum ruoffiae TaxID=89093 RepID=A0A1H8ZPG4_9LACT|nr:helix-turn-helix domain-containing protein [Ignavigranum ruoffiae]SEP66292.1 Helix-turn-helix domain-containing protein [Ignavigranum ruoffiae]
MSELGSKLRDARIERGYTLNTLQQKTKIQKKYLQAIEDGQFDILPGQYYVRAFVKQYADIVGLNGNQLLEDHEAEIINPVEEEEDFVEESSIPSRLERHQQGEKSQWEHVLSYLPMILLITIILLIIATLIFAIQSISQKDKVETGQKEQESAIVSVVEPDTVEVEETNETNTESTQESLAENQIKVGKQVITLLSEPTEETLYQLENPIEEYEFEVKADAFVWVGIYQDDVIQVDTPVAEGESVTFKPQPGAKTIRLRLGYPEGGKFYVNGKEIEAKSDYIKETIVFQLADDVKETPAESIPLDLPGDESSQATEAEASESSAAENTGYQGPAVYDPNYSGE